MHARCAVPIASPTIARHRPPSPAIARHDSVARCPRSGYYLIPVVTATGFVLLGAEEVAIQLEQPFGDDQNDLPLDSYCFMMEADLLTLLDEPVEGL